MRTHRKGPRILLLPGIDSLSWILQGHSHPLKSWPALHLVFSYFIFSGSAFLFFSTRTLAPRIFSSIAVHSFLMFSCCISSRSICTIRTIKPLPPTTNVEQLRWGRTAVHHRKMTNWRISSLLFWWIFVKLLTKMLKTLRTFENRGREKTVEFVLVSRIEKLAGRRLS